MRSLVLLISVLAACAEAPTDDQSDGEAEAAPEQALGKADGQAFTGLYAASAATTLHTGDVPSLELRADGSYVRSRCYRTSCSLQVAETDHFDTYTSSAGKTYVRFYSFTSTWNADHSDRMQTPVVADVYEIKKTSTTIQLRKSYTTRWVTLRKTTAATTCSHSGGTWSSGECTCAGNTGWSEDGYAGFVAGAGGCITIPGADESECDDSDGYYTDDDSTLVGTFCQCARGKYLTNTGCAAI